MGEWTGVGIGGVSTMRKRSTGESTGFVRGDVEELWVSSQRIDQSLDHPVEVGVGAAERVDLADRVNDGRVVFSAEGLADIGKAGAGERLR